MITEENLNYYLHLLCNVSSHAYGAVAYLATGYHFRSTGAAIKNRILLQLELAAIQVDAHLATYIARILKSIKSRGIFSWSENKAAFQWMKNDICKTSYVKNKITEIRETASQFFFLHVQTKSISVALLSRLAT